MAEIKIDYKGFLSKLNITRSLYILAFILIVILFSLYSIVVNQNGKERLHDMYALKNQHDYFEIIQSDFLDKVQESLIYTLLYFSEAKEIYRFQAIEALNDANSSYNELFAYISENESGLVNNAILLKDHLITYENNLLAKLATNSELPELELAPIIADEDTISQDFAEFIPTMETSGISLSEEEVFIKNIESEVFEINVLLTAHHKAISSEKASQGIVVLKVYFLYAAFFLLVFIILYEIIKKFNQRRISKSSLYLQSISTGELPEKLQEEKDDHVTIVQNSNLISDYMHDASEFALKIGDGNFEYEFTPKSNNDKLGNALIQMRNRLQQVANEDRIRNWVNEGQAKFGEILRETSNDIHEMGDALISNLVNYVGASMGAIYIKNEDHGEIKMELLSAFAFNRKKHEERVLNPGEGLAGQVFIEKKRVFIKDLQNDHFNISTGMGESRPASVLIVPLKDENDVEGVLELASFNVLEQYQMDFVEKLGESIASAIKSGKTNSVTKHLLEEMQTREEQMKTQEEELKQNMEELSATQEQMERLRKEDEARKAELESKRRTLYNVLDHLESKVYLKDANGRYQYINAKYAEFVGQTIESIIGTTDDELLGSEISVQRSNWEKSVLKTTNSLTEEEELNGEKHTLTLSFIEIDHLDGKGILGELK